MRVKVISHNADKSKAMVIIDGKTKHVHRIKGQEFQTAERVYGNQRNDQGKMVPASWIEYTRPSVTLPAF
jgi:hypothetical protein